MKKRIVALLPALLVWCLLGPTHAALADGTETLGPPSIPIATGTGVVSAGTGLTVQPGTINLAVPAGASIEQVLLYWEGEELSGFTESDAPGDNTIVIDGVEVEGTLIGGPVEFFVDLGEFVDASSYRADITDLNLVTPGANSFQVEGLAFTYANEGASVVVIFDDGSQEATIGVRDGIDLAFKLFDEPKKSTVPQTFTFPAAGVARIGEMHLAVGSVEEDRPNSVKITAGPVVVTHVLGSPNGWDNPILPVTILPGVTSVTVEVISGDEDSFFDSASLAWVNAIFALTGVNACVVTGVAPITHGSAYSADVRVLNLPLLNKVGSVATVAPGAPSSAGKNLLNVGLPLAVLNAKVLTTQSNSSLAPSPNSTSSATVADVNVLGGAIKATTISAVSQSTASPNGSSFNSSGSTFQGLKINNVSLANVAPNTTVSVKNPLIPSQVIAEAHLYEETGSTSSANGAWSSSHSVNAIRVVLLKPFLGLAAGAQIVIAHAESDAKSPQTACPESTSVSGEAFTALATTSLLGEPLTFTKAGTAALPPTGGADSDGVVAHLPGVVTSATADNSTSGSLSPNPNATSRSRVEGANVLGGVVTAGVLDVSSTSAANGTTAGTTFQSTFLNLKVGGVTINPSVAPNTTRIVPLPGGGSVIVILNERVVNTNGTSDTEGTINAIHVFVLTPGGILQAEVIVASAHSDAHM